MPELSEYVFSALQEVHTLVSYHHPAVMTQFPCLIFFESGNDVHARADGKAYLHEIEYTLEIYALSPEIAHSLSAAADEKMRELGFSRSYCCDLFDDDSRAHRRVMRYRALCDNHNILTQ
ncbi:MAG: hypothetical protein IKW00_08895 [Clostridia bacterium]|nr:hypothetical protein [Clostridia bacterium]